MRAISRTIISPCMLVGALSAAFAGNGHKMERIHYRIMTDRSIYVVGEDVDFRVFNLNSGFLREPGLSSVYYLEFVSPGGDPYVQLKLPLDTLGAAGGFRIPDEIPSGTYYLKGYTRYLRNMGPTAYSYLSITVINPFVKTVLNVDTTSAFSVSLQRQNWSCYRLDYLRDSGKQKVLTRTGYQPELQQEPIGSIMDGCMTVARPGALSGQWEYSKAVSPPHDQNVKLIPETRGIALSGKVSLQGSDQPIPYAEVYVTSIDRKKEFKCNYTDSLGFFYIVLGDKKGVNELFITAAHSPSEDLDISIDRDFCAEPVLLPSFPVSLEKLDEKMVLELSINAQIRAQYDTGSSPVVDTTDEETGKFFYGEPSASIRLSDFIRLPSLEEYVEEVIPQVSLRGSHGHRKFRVLGTNPDLQFFEPLMMVDGVAVFDIESILAISPRFVERIEVIIKPYIRGVMTFGGIINLVTTNGKMGYMDLPASGILLEYTMYSDTPSTFTQTVPGDPKIPDVRNTLCWEPMINPLQKRTVNGFYTADAEGTYCILIRGYDPEGRFLVQSFPLQVQ